MRAQYEISAVFSGDPGSFSIQAQDDTLDVSLAVVAIDSRLRAESHQTIASVIPNMDAIDYVVMDALDQAFMLDNPTSVNAMVEGRKLLVRILDNGTAQALTFGSKFVGLITPLPAATIPNKTMYLGFMYHAGGDTWDLIALSRQP